MTERSDDPNAPENLPAHIRADLEAHRLRVEAEREAAQAAEEAAALAIDALEGPIVIGGIGPAIEKGIGFQRPYREPTPIEPTTAEVLADVRRLCSLVEILIKAFQR